MTCPERYSMTKCLILMVIVASCLGMESELRSLKNDLKRRNKDSGDSDLNEIRSKALSTLRITRFEFRYAGRVEILYKNVWKPIKNIKPPDHIAVAMVVCRQLGYGQLRYARPGRSYQP